MNSKTVYRIRNIVNDKFSTGGSKPEWVTGKDEKVFPSLQALASHLARHRLSWYGGPCQNPVKWEDLEIVVSEVVEQEVGVMPLKKYRDQLEEKRSEREIKWKAEMDRMWLKRKVSEYHRLGEEIKKLKEVVSGTNQ